MYAIAERSATVFAVVAALSARVTGRHPLVEVQVDVDVKNFDPKRTQLRYLTSTSTSVVW